MKNILVLILYLFPFFMLAQARDERALLKLGGGIGELSISPDGKCWLVSDTDKLSSTSNIDSNWTTSYLPLGKIIDDYRFSHLNRILFFNQDTAIINGYISLENKYNSRKGAYFHTKDGGKNWTKRDYGGDSWIYTSQVDKNGNAWMGGGSKELYISNDYGINWITIKVPYQHSTRTYAIQMLSPNYGVLGSENNEILLTRDAWKTVESIVTPFDQNKIKEPTNGEYQDLRISKVVIWNDYVVVQQCDEVFYSKRSKIEWIKFPNDLGFFVLNDQNNSIVALSKDDKVIEFNTPLNYSYITENKSDYYMDNLLVEKGEIYSHVEGNVVAKIENKNWEYKTMYTTDYNIETPRVIKTAKDYSWGISGRHVYLSTRDSNWYREAVLPCEVTAIDMVNDSTVIFWDGVKNNYKYNLKDKRLIKYIYDKPISHFLKSPIHKMKIKSTALGCFDYDQEIVKYALSEDSILICDKYHSVDENNPVKEFSYSSSPMELHEILNNINNNTEKIPSIQDFNITKKDIIRYKEYLNDQFENNFYFRNFSSKKKKFYQEIVLNLDTLSSSNIENILDKKEEIMSTSSVRFEVVINNNIDDKIILSRNYYHNTTPWNLPWKVEYNGSVFNTYDIEFSKYIKNGLPEEFIHSYSFDNVYLILEIAEYFSNELGIE